MANVVLRHVNKSFGRVEAVRDISFSVAREDFSLAMTSRE